MDQAHLLQYIVAKFVNMAREMAMKAYLHNIFIATIWVSKTDQRRVASNHQPM
ncbi:MAG: hypothetical protein QXT39_04965 [Conexivisphaerales archaeon]